ncbi:MAG: ABC transporter ATP-binding protein [Myxococcota bacterium]
MTCGATRSAIRARGVTVRVRSRGQDRIVVDAVDLDVAPGELVGLIGPNGGGKSTLLLALAGLVAPSSGTIDRTGTIGLVTTEPGLYPLLTGRENLRFFLGLHGWSPERVDAAIGPALAQLGVTDRDLAQPAGTYSSGTRQKVSLARALVTDPAALLLDEPTSNVDPRSARVLLGAVRARADAGVAVVLATHDLHAAEHLCDRVVALDRAIVGRATLSGPRTVPPPTALEALVPS